MSSKHFWFCNFLLNTIHKVDKPDEKCKHAQQKLTMGIVCTTSHTLKTLVYVDIIIFKKIDLIEDN